MLKKSASFCNTTETTVLYVKCKVLYSYETQVAHFAGKIKLMKTLYTRSTYSLTLAFGGTWRAGWITTAKLSFVPYKPLFTSSSRRYFCWKTIHKHYWGILTRGNFSCNMSCDFTTSNAPWKIALCNIPWNDCSIAMLLLQQALHKVETHLTFYNSYCNKNFPRHAYIQECSTRQ